MTAKLAYVLAGLAVVAVGGAFFLGWYSGTKSGDSTQPGAPAPVAGAAPAAAPARPATAGSAAPAQPQLVTTATYGSWQVRCLRPAPAKGNGCSALLQIAQKETGNVLFAWIVANGKNGLVTVLETPTGVQIQSGLEVKIGDSPVRHIAYANCLPQRCTSEMPADEVLLKQMSTGGKAKVSVVAADGRGVEFAMSLAGFDKALTAITK